MSDKKLSAHGVDEQEMLSELSELESIIRSAVPGSDSDPETSLALVRLVRDLSEGDIRRFLEAHDLADRWLCLSLSEDFPALERFSRLLESLIRDRDRDYLTGLKNRRFFERVLTRELELAWKFRVPVTVVILDVDDFKQINDTHGHSLGDRVLRDLSAILKEEVRATDTVARIGGEEFAMLLSGSGMRQSEKTLERIRERIVWAAISGGEDEEVINFTASFGAATYRGIGQMDGDSIFDFADKALYRAKEKGKNRVEISVVTGLRDKETAVVGREEKKFLFSGL
jgi:diguanylate cyclase (GGDEF)-like protein